MLIDIVAVSQLFDPMFEVDLFAHMCFPDPKQRAEYLLYNKLRIIAKEAERSHENASSLLKHWLTPDEVKMLPHQPSQQTINKMLYKAGFGTSVAADILLRIMQIDRFKEEYPEIINRGASFNKAIHMISCEYQGLKNQDGKPLPTNRNDLIRQWSAYKPVAHLCVAHRLVSTAFPDDTPWYETILGKLMFAELFWYFGTEHCPYVQKAPTLPPDKTHKILVNGVRPPFNLSS